MDAAPLERISELRALEAKIKLINLPDTKSLPNLLQNERANIKYGYTVLKMVVGEKAREADVEARKAEAEAREAKDNACLWKHRINPDFPMASIWISAASRHSIPRVTFIEREMVYLLENFLRQVDKFEKNSEFCIDSVRAAAEPIWTTMRLSVRDLVSLTSGKGKDQFNELESLRKRELKENQQAYFMGALQDLKPFMACLFSEVKEIAGIWSFWP
jgi:hypothetical protein